MSSTNRGYSRHASDYYVTPLEPIREFFAAWLQDESEGDYKKIIQEPDKAKWLDPCAGGDAEHGMSYPMVIKELFDPHVLNTIDAREDSPAMLCGDYLKREDTRGHDIIITNPPFYLAKEIIEKALDDVNQGGYVIMLLRLNFLGSQSRKQFWDLNPPKAIYVHHKRMSFTTDNKTDSIEYAHFVWEKGWTGRTTITVI